MNELAAEVKSLKALTKDMGGSVVQQENEIKKVQQQAELVMKANSIVENNKLIEEKMEEANNLVQTYKEDIKKTYAEILKEKEEMKQQKVEKMDIRKEVKEVIRSNPKFIKDTVDINTSVVFFGVKQVDIYNRIDRDKKELETISKLLTTVAGEGEEIVVEEFSRLGKYVYPMWTGFLRWHCKIPMWWKWYQGMQKKIQEKEEWRNVWVNRCLNKEDRDKLREKVEEARKKNEELSEEEARHFFYKVVGMQVKKWYKNRDIRRFP